MRVYKIFREDKSISSPFYPGYYPTWQRCTWIASPPPQHVVGFQFIDFDLGPNDYVETRNGDDKTADHLELFSGKPKLHYWWVSRGRHVWFRFKSHLNFTFRGFNIKFKFLKKPKGEKLQQ